MKNILMAISFVLVSSLVVFSQTDSPKGQVKKLKEQQVIPSPVLGFKKQTNAPFKILYSATYAVKKNTQDVEIKLNPKNLSGKTIRTFTVYCEEEFRQTKDKEVAKQIHQFSSKEIQPIVFQVQKDSKLTLWVASVEFEDGTVWSNN